MPLSVTRFEAGKIFDRQTDAISRLYPDGCPHEVGSRVVLVVDDNIVARAVIKSIRPESVESRFADEEVARKDGFSGAAAWKHHFQQMYGPVTKGKVFRLQFNLEELFEPF